MTELNLSHIGTLDCQIAREMIRRRRTSNETSLDAINRNIKNLTEIRGYLVSEIDSPMFDIMHEIWNASID